MEYYDVGKIVNTHGLKGEVRVHAVTSHPEERFAKDSPLTLEKKNGEKKEVVVKSHRKHKSFDLLTFEAHPSINDVEEYVGGMLKVSEENLFELEEDEFYVHELVGSQVIDEEGHTIGELKDVLSPGANDVWVVKRKKQKDLLLPYIDSVILDVNLEEKIITAHILEGLDD